MKKLLLLVGLTTAGTLLLAPFSTVVESGSTKGTLKVISPEYKWTQVAPPGSGTHQYEWVPGTYPSAIVPVLAFDNELWMVGQKKAWSSADGIKWKDLDKHDWGERISMAQVFFKNKFWVSGGMDYSSNTFLNEIWSSENGRSWTKIVSNAEWSPRKGHTVVVFKDRLWLFGGETSVDKNKAPDEFANDIWSSTDGIQWTKVLEEAPWQARGNPQVLVFKDALWLIGGQGHSDIWNSVDGKVWTKLKDHSPWRDRYDYGLAAFDNFIWVYGGRETNPRNAYNDVWFSPNGIDWIQQTAEAPWSRRSGGYSIVFRDKLFLFGGKHTGHKDGFSGDIWTMEKVISRLD